MFNENIVNHNTMKKSNNNNTNINNDNINISKITNLDLYSNQYTEDILIYNMHKLSPHSVLTTQNNLSNEFIYNYILNKKYVIFREDRDITINEILKYFNDFGKYNPKQ